MVYGPESAENGILKSSHKVDAAAVFDIDTSIEIILYLNISTCIWMYLDIVKGIDTANKYLERRTNVT